MINANNLIKKLNCSYREFSSRGNESNKCRFILCCYFPAWKHKKGLPDSKKKSVGRQ